MQTQPVQTLRHPPLAADTEEPGGIGLATLPSFFVQYASQERVFLGVLLAAFMLVAVTFQTPAIAMWVGFLFAGYSAVANDSIQTIGTFIASNRDTKWWILWLFIGGIFLVTALTSWYLYDGDVSYERLASKGFETAPTSFSYLQIAAPLFLLILTRLRMPVSTTFLLLSSFATSGSSIWSILEKSFIGYGIAFGAAIALWFAVSKVIDRWQANGPAHPLWRVGQWLSTGVLWAVWLMQDAANVAVYLPRSLSMLEVGAFCLVIFLGLGLLFRQGGERVQQVVDEKSSVVDVRAATVIDLVYAVILYWFKEISEVPMSTTWVFIGLLGGREIAMSLRKSGNRSVGGAVKLLLKDLGFVTIGLVVSLILAMVVNEAVRRDLLASLGLG